MSGAQAQVPKGHPLMKAWEAHKATEEYANSRKWAAHEEHVDGSLWALFVAGWNAGTAAAFGMEVISSAAKEVMLPPTRESDPAAPEGAPSAVGNSIGAECIAPPLACRRFPVAERYPPLPKVGPIGYASIVDVQSYAPWLKIGPHLPGVRDVALWTTDQMRAYVDADRAARGVAPTAPAQALRRLLAALVGSSMVFADDADGSKGAEWISAWNEAKRVDGVAASAPAGGGWEPDAWAAYIAGVLVSYLSSENAARESDRREDAITGIIRRRIHWLMPARGVEASDGGQPG